MRHNTISHSLRFCGVFVRFRLPRTPSLWVGDEAPLLSVSLHRNKAGEVNLVLQAVCMLVMVGAARRTPAPEPASIV